MHDVFRVSMLRKYIPDSNLVIEYELSKIQEGRTCVDPRLERASVAYKDNLNCEGVVV